MFKKLCPWCADHPRSNRKMRRFKQYDNFLIKRGSHQCKYCGNIYRSRLFIFNVSLLYLGGLTFALLWQQTTSQKISIWILVGSMFLLSFIYMSFFPHIWNENKDNTTYEFISKKVQIRWVERENGGLSLPRLRVLTRDVFLIEPAPDAAIPEENPAHFIVITKFFSRKKGTAEMAYLVPNALPDEFFLLHKKRRIAHCRVIANGTKKIRIPPGRIIIVDKLSEKNVEWE